MPRLLESIALEKADVEPGEDHTLPPYDRIRKKLGDLAETFKTECGFDESAALAPVKPAGGKRKAESSDGAAKKPKAEGSMYYSIHHEFTGHSLLPPFHREPSPVVL